MTNREYDGTSPLPDSDLLYGDQTTENTSAEAAVDTNDTVVNTAETVAKQPRRRWSYADDYMTVNLGEPTGDTVTSLVFDMGTLPEKAYAHLAAFAVTILCGRVDDPAAEFARLVTGVAAERKPKSEPKPKVDFWRQAIALAFVDSTKKAPAGQMTIETATEKAKAIGKERLRELKLDPVVVKHFNKLTGGTKGYSVAALLADEATAEAA